MNGAPWWVTLAVGALTAAAALGGTVIASWRQNRRARREEWFRRVQWAQQLTASDRERDQETGYRLLASLADSDLAAADDLRLLYNLTDAGALSAPNEPALFVVEDTETNSTDSADEEDQ